MQALRYFAPPALYLPTAEPPRPRGRAGSAGRGPAAVAAFGGGRSRTTSLYARGAVRNAPSRRLALRLGSAVLRPVPSNGIQTQCQPGLSALKAHRTFSCRRPPHVNLSLFLGPESPVDPPSCGGLLAHVLNKYSRL